MKLILNKAVFRVDIISNFYIYVTFRSFHNGNFAKGKLTTLFIFLLMKLFFKVLVLIGLIAVGKWERENSFNINESPAAISYPGYTQNASNNLAPKEVNANQQKDQVYLHY